MEYTTKASTADQFINEIKAVKAQGNFTVEVSREMDEAWAVLKATLPVGEQAADEVKVRAAFDTNISGTQSPFNPVNQTGIPFEHVITPAKTVDEFIANVKRTNTYSGSAWTTLKNSLPIVQQADAEKTIQEVLTNQVPSVVRTN